MFKIILTSLLITASIMDMAYSISLSDLIPRKKKQCSVQIKPNEKQSVMPVYFVIKLADNGNIGLYAEAKMELKTIQIILGEDRLPFSPIETSSINDIKDDKRWTSLLDQKLLYLTAKLDNGNYTSSTYKNLKSNDIFRLVKSQCAKFIASNSFKYLIPPQYENATAFENGVAVVKKNGLWGLIDTNNNWVVKPYYDEVGTYNDGYLSVMKERSGNKVWGLIDYKGNLVQSMQHQGMGKCSQGRCAVKIGEKWGYISPEGGIVIPVKYDFVRDFKEGFSAVKEDNSWYLIDRNGKAHLGYKKAIIYSPSENLLVAKEKGKNAKRGFVNLKGDVVIPVKFSRVKRFSESFAAVRNKKKWGYINNHGSLVIPYQYKSAKLFKGGLAPVENTNGKWGFINKRGQWVIEAKFKMAYPFKNGIATIRVDNPSDEKNPFRGFINLKGEFIYEPIFENVYNFSEGTAPVKVSGKWGFIKKPDAR